MRELTENSETALLGLLISTPDHLDDCGALNNFEDPFSENRFNVVFTALKSIYTKESKVPLKMLLSACNDAGISRELIMSLIKSKGLAVNVKRYVSEVVDEKSKRMISETAIKLVSASSDPINTSEKYFKMMKQTVEKIEDSSINTKNQMTLKEGVEKVVQDAMAMANGDKSSFMKTGLTKLDGLLNGLRRKTMSVWASRPSIGKSSVAMSILNNMSNRGVHSGFVSVEMHEDELIRRWAQYKSKVPFNDFALSNLERDKRDYFQALTEIKDNKNTQIVKTSDRKISTIRAEARKMKKKDPNISIIWVDYLQKVESDDPRQEPTAQVAEISGVLTDLASELDVHIACLAQLNRGADDSEVPKMKHLKQSSRIEEDANTVVLIHRELAVQFKANQEGDFSPKPCQLIVCKNRDGASGIAECEFNAKLALFQNSYEGSYSEHDEY